MTTGPTRRLPRSAALIAAALLACTGVAGCAGDADTAASASPSSTGPASPGSTSPTSPASAFPVTSAASSGASEEPAPRALPAALFEEGGMTLLEYSDSPDPNVKYIDTAKETVVEEVLGTGELQVTLADARKGDEYRIQLLCPSDATGKSDIYVSTTPTGERDWKAGSEDACGDWSAGLPALEKDGPFTVTVTVANDRPFRVAVTQLLD